MGFLQTLFLVAFVFFKCLQGPAECAKVSGNGNGGSVHEIPDEFQGGQPKACSKFIAFKIVFQTIFNDDVSPYKGGLC